MSGGERFEEARNFDPLDSENVAPKGDEVQETTEYRFPEEHKEPFRGLNFLGRLTTEFEYIGHKIVIKTLTTDEILAVSQILKKYEGTVGQAKAYATAIVASCIISVDDQPLVSPIGEDANTPYAQAWQRFNYIKSRWHPTTVQAVYNEYIKLEDQVDAVLAEMGKALG